MPGVNPFSMRWRPGIPTDTTSAGVVRKQLGFSFLGETREEGQFLIGLVEVQGLGTEV